MQYRTLGESDSTLPVISFGAGPVSGLMVGRNATAQLETISHAVDSGINYFDTAATYGSGRSETALGIALETLHLRDRVRIATKVRLMPEQLGDIGRAVRESFESSCRRLGVERVMLLQLHNSITENRNDLPTSLTVHDVLGRDGVVSEFEKLRQEGRIDHIGFTGLGDRNSLRKVISNGPFETAQVPLHVLLPLTGVDASAGSVDVNYRELSLLCHDYCIGVIGIRVLAGGALAGQKPSAHTHKTKFFPMDLYQRDRNRTEKMAQLLPETISPVAASIRYVTGNLQATTALIGFSTPTQIDQTITALKEGPLEEALVQQIETLPVSGMQEGEAD